MQGALYRVCCQLLPSSMRWQLHTAIPASSVGCLIATRGKKTTTGIVGVPVDHDARQHLVEKLNAVKDALTQHDIPPDSAYFASVSDTVAMKLEALASDKADVELEDMFASQLEMEIRKCEDELALIPKMAEWKPWEVPEGYKVEMVEEKMVADEIKAAAPPTPTPPPPPPPAAAAGAKA